MMRVTDSFRMSLESAGSASLDELVALRLACRLLVEEYRTLKLELPPWLGRAEKGLGLQIGKMVQATLLADLERAEARLEGLKTQSERRADTEREIAALRERLK